MFLAWTRRKVEPRGAATLWMRSKGGSMACKVRLCYGKAAPRRNRCPRPQSAEGPVGCKGSLECERRLPDEADRPRHHRKALMSAATRARRDLSCDDMGGIARSMPSNS